MNDIKATQGVSSVIDNLSIDRNKPETERTERDMFLELMMAQMENQDPLSPQDNGEFLSQLAQFSTVEGIDKLNNSMSSFEQGFRSSQALQATALVGRKVEVSGSESTLEAGKTVDGVITLPQSSGDLKLQIYDNAGGLVAAESLGSAAAGEVPFSWDGKGLNGNQLPPGNYRFEATALQEGERVSLQTALFANVNSVTLGAGGAVTLNVDNIGPIALDDVKKIQ